MFFYLNKRNENNFRNSDLIIICFVSSISYANKYSNMVKSNYNSKTLLTNSTILKHGL